MDDVALRGGPPACPPGTVPPWPVHDEREARALQGVLESGRWSRLAGEEVDAFERELAAFEGCAHALAVTSGTQALELALEALGIGFGDEVIVPGFTFAATATAVLRAGAMPVAVDVDPRTCCLDPEAAAAAITERTRAIVPVHMAGHGCDMERLRALCEGRGIRLVSDSAHAPGARWGGESVASLSDVAIYSFQAFKLITAGEGGALVTRDARVRERAWLRHSCGRPRGDTRYRHLELGTNARLNELQGAILRAQLQRLPAQTGEREAAAHRLDRLLEGVPGLRPVGRHPKATTHCHDMYLVQVDRSETGLTRDELVDLLVAEGVPAFRASPPIPELGFFASGRLWSGRHPRELSPSSVFEAVHRHPIPVSRRISDEVLWLHHPVLLGGERVQEAVALAFKKAVAYGRASGR